ncbi:hypothetical protein [Micromonospora marina]|uniref:hypothetical protein n=1 Tax=Micromonospora marina TaxID=307120 RepID=UPI00345707BD
MTYVGQRETLRLQVRDEEGALSDATVVLTVTRPDTTTTQPVVSHDGVGLYSAQVTYDQAGDWLRVWQVSGSVVAVDADQVHITAPVLRLVGLAEVKAQLNIAAADTSQDAELADYIDVVTEVVEHIVGPVVPRQVVETHDGGSEALVLRRPPVLEVTAVTEGGVALTSDAWAMSSAGILYRPAGRWRDARGAVTVTYRAGRASVPASIRQAAKELLALHWRSQQGGNYSPFDTGGEPGDGQVILGFFVPGKVMQLLRPHEQIGGFA